jgi:hypothetical protein
MFASRLVVLLLEHAAEETPLIIRLVTRFAGVAGAALVLPIAIVAMDRLQARPGEKRLAMFALDLVSGMAIGLVTQLLYYSIGAFDWMWTVFVFFSAVGMLASSAASGLVGAVRWSRSVLEADALAARLVTAESLRTRQLIEERFRPAATVARLHQIARLLHSDVARAVNVLYRLARHERVLLLRHRAKSIRHAIALERRDISFTIHGLANWPSTPKAAEAAKALDDAVDASEGVSIRVDLVTDGGRVCARIGALGRGADAFWRTLTGLCGHKGIAATVAGGRMMLDLGAAPAAIDAADGMERPDRRTFIVVIELLIFIVVFYSTDLELIEWHGPWLTATASLISVPLWFVAGPLVGWKIERDAFRRFPVMLAEAVLLTMLAAAVITLVSIAGVGLVSATPWRSIFELPATTAIIFRRNNGLAMVIGATSIAAGIGRVLRARHAMVARLQSEVHRAEAREIEACFHPHFLLNALTSIKALARTRPEEAAAMSRHLADLVEKIVSCSGRPYWTVREELDLVADYLEIQRMRFKKRLRIELWNIDPAAREQQMPRFILLPLIENIFKHAVAQSQDAVTVGLDLRCRLGKLQVAIWNDAAPDRVPASLGRGLSFVLHRVEEAGGVVNVGAKRDGRFLVQYALPRLTVA